MRETDCVRVSVPVIDCDGDDEALSDWLWEGDDDSVCDAVPL